MPETVRVLPLVLLAVLLWQPAWADDADSTRVAVVFGSHSFRQATSDEAALVRKFADTVMAALDAVGVPYAVLDDSDVEAGRLSAHEVAIFPYNFVIPEAEEEAIAGYILEGGKVLAFYTPPARVAELLGIRILGRAEGEYKTIRLDQSLLSGLPPSVRQDSWNIRRAEVVRPWAKVIGRWYGPDGKSLGEPALIMSPNGAYMGHVLTAGDVGNKGLMLLAVLERFLPDLRSGAGERAVAAGSRHLDALSMRLAGSAASTRNRSWANTLLAEARAQMAEARKRAALGRDMDAIKTALAARDHASLVYALSSSARSDECRGVWIHNARGIPGWGWERSIRTLRDCGFNALVANMLWAGLAYYPSEHLPVAPSVAEHGDQIAECLKWCSEFGIELHAWKVNFNLETAPAEFLDRLRQEGRLQRDRDGSEIAWLCPSDPRNLALERDSMLEVVRKYDVAGIHFDYIRYPHEGACYCNGCRCRFEEAAGVTIERWPDDVLRDPLGERFAQWRRDQITKLVRAVATEARRIRPGIMISAAVFDWPASRDWAGQDWKQWVDEGLLDFVCPMDYTMSLEYFDWLIRQQVETVAGKALLYPGIGEFIIGDSDEVVRQIEVSRRLGADGFVCFSYEHLVTDEKRLAALRHVLTDTPASPPHPAPRVRFELGPCSAGEMAPSFTEGDPITVRAAFVSGGNYAEPIAQASGELIVETTDGLGLRDLGRVSSADGEPVALTLTLPSGRYRLAIRGEATLVSETRRFVVRSRPFGVLPTDRAPEILANGEPTP